MAAKLSIVLVLLFMCAVLIGLAFVMRATGGLFWSRTLNQFQRDRNDPKYQLERNVGTGASALILKIISPIAIALVIILGMVVLGVI
ncbi:hypothetical protein ACYSNU_00085 [Enterococcus sp. LJL120]